MYCFVMDTATSWTMAALLRDGKLVEQRIFSNSRKLVEAAHEMLTSAHILPEQLGCIGVGIGPGSYTGIRIAASIGKAMSMALQVPLVGVSSLKGFHPPEYFQGKFLVAFDAKISGFYCIEGEQKDGIPHFASDAEIVPLDAFLKKIEHYSCIVTPSDDVSKKIEKHPLILEVAPDPIVFGQHALEAFSKGLFSTDGTVDLLYLRKTQAEIQTEINVQKSQ